MTIQDEARDESTKRYVDRFEQPLEASAVHNARVDAFERGYIAGASRPVTDVETRAVVAEVYGPDEPEQWQMDNARAALTAAREVSK